jgi:hypothetical protein
MQSRLLEELIRLRKERKQAIANTQLEIQKNNAYYAERAAKLDQWLQTVEEPNLSKHELRGISPVPPPQHAPPPHTKS